MNFWNPLERRRTDPDGKKERARFEELSMQTGRTKKALNDLKESTDRLNELLNEIKQKPAH